MDHPPHRLSRRGFLTVTIAAAIGVACGDSDPQPAAGLDPAPAPTVEPTPDPTAPPVPTGPNPFMLGVASGDPTSDSVILWTRLEPSDLRVGDVEVGWEVAADPEMAEPIAAGTAIAVAALGHSVHAEASGLPADGVHYYRFTLDGHASDVGRTRTFAAPGAMPDSFRFAFSSCQNWEDGYYAAYRDVAGQADLDAFVFLGDYIYESASGGLADAHGRLTGQAFECETLEQYRQRYALYRSDPHLRAAHAEVPWIITWDDHEVDNNYATAVSENDDDAAAFLARRAAAYQAWYEFMPVRLDPPVGPDYDIYRTCAHGDLIRFHVLDTRQYRSDQQGGEPIVPALGDGVQVRDDAYQFAGSHTMLGDAQHDWLITGIAGSAAVWDVLAQQVLMFGANALPGADPPVVVVDTWDGYAGPRQRLLDAVGTGRDGGAENLVVLTGDFHSAAVGVLRADPFDLDAPPVGVELMAPSISSAFFDADASIAGLVDLALANNPQLRFFDSRSGYTLCDVAPERWRATYRAVADIFDEGSAVETIAVWTIEAGTPDVVAGE